MALGGTDDWARQAAEWLVGCLEGDRGRMAVALSGGSTPAQLYVLLASGPFVDRVPWDKVHWFWGDERFVPPDHPSSNYRMAMQTMLQHVPVPEDNIHPVPTLGLTPLAAAQAYENELYRFHGSNDPQPPVFQVVLLGLGTNGHFASLFPNTPALDERMSWAAVVTPEGEETRITLTYPVLESCRHAGFLVTGAEKRDVLARVRAGDPALPASNYRPAGELRWFTDPAAEGG